MTTPALDDLDRELIRILGKDARLSNRKIAGELGVTEGTVRGRIKRLQQDRLIAFTAITSFDLTDENRLAFIGVQAEVENVRQVAEQIGKMEAVNGVLITMGRFNILAISLFNELDHLHQIASDDILSLSGVHHVETSIAVRTLKYNSRVVRITEADHALNLD